jgi:hypothetical protein
MENQRGLPWNLGVQFEDNLGDRVPQGLFKSAINSRIWHRVEVCQRTCGVKLPFNCCGQFSSTRRNLELILREYLWFGVPFGNADIQCTRVNIDRDISDHVTRQIRVKKDMHFNWIEYLCPQFCGDTVKVQALNVYTSLLPPLAPSTLWES